MKAMAKLCAILRNPFGLHSKDYRITTSFTGRNLPCDKIAEPSDLLMKFSSHFNGFSLKSSESNSITIVVNYLQKY